MRQETAAVQGRGPVDTPLPPQAKMTIKNTNNRTYNRAKVKKYHCGF